MKEAPILLVDAGTGNLHSVQKALESLSAQVIRTSDPEQVRRARRLILPGVGAFGAFIQKLRETSLDVALQEARQSEAKMLGICLGMQVLFEFGEEMGRFAGLSWLEGQVVAFPPFAALTVPHTGWNQIHLLQPADPLFRGIADGEYFYFNHSFYCQPKRAEDILAQSEHGIPFTAAVRRENIWGVQFHPEKSQRAGLRLLRNFLEL